MTTKLYVCIDQGVMRGGITVVPRHRYPSAIAAVFFARKAIATVFTTAVEGIYRDAAWTH